MAFRGGYGMAKERIVSKLKQTRGINTKEKIIEATERYFCENGYYEASIRKLADAANVSIGSFYFYFKDKDELLVEVYRRQNERFLQTISNSLSETEQYKNDRKTWLRKFILDLLGTYGNSGKLRSELKALNYENPQIALQKKQIKNQTVRLMMESIGSSPIINDLKVKHPQIALLFIIDMVDSTYDRIASGDKTDNTEDVMEECFDAVYKYLFL
jgi:AcrR family transcriptional regulator